MLPAFFKLLFRPLFWHAAHRCIKGRMIDLDNRDLGRFYPHDISQILARSWRIFDELWPEAGLDKIPTVDNRLNVLMSVITISAYHSFIAAEIDKQRAVELVADIGWSVYTKLIVVPRFVSRIVARNPQKRINFILRALLIFPFSAPGRPGYEVMTRVDEQGFHTDWTHCPPLAFVRHHMDVHGDNGELEAFRRSWCSYDWAFLHFMVGGKIARKTSYTRPHTMSEGDAVCDMCWSANGGCKDLGLLAD